MPKIRYAEEESCSLGYREGRNCDGEARLHYPSSPATRFIHRLEKDMQTVQNSQQNHSVAPGHERGHTVSRKMRSMIAA
jgi:hypothetical protein